MSESKSERKREIVERRAVSDTLVLVGHFRDRRGKASSHRQWQRAEWRGWSLRDALGERTSGHTDSEWRRSTRRRLFLRDRWHILEM